MKLTPPDFDQCQCEWLGGSFMTFGPRSMERCKKQPAWLLTEKKADPAYEGVGRMTLCPECLEKFDKREDVPAALTTPIMAKKFRKEV